MEGMKQKAGRKTKGTPTADELNSDEKLAQEMGMSVSKLNRIIRLSEATKDVCDRVDDGTLALSIASATRTRCSTSWTWATASPRNGWSI